LGFNPGNSIARVSGLVATDLQNSATQSIGFGKGLTIKQAEGS
jgi:hypothetical protein